MVEDKRVRGQFTLVDKEGILFIQGRRLAGGTQPTPDFHQHKEHLLFGEGEQQQTSYCVPVVSPYRALGVAVAQSLHDKMCGESAASTMARASQYFHFMPTPGPLFRTLSSSCYRCCRIKMKVDICGPYTGSLTSAWQEILSTQGCKQKARNKPINHSVIYMRGANVQ